MFWLRERVAREMDPTLTMTTLRAAAGYWLLKKGSGTSRDYKLSGIMLDSIDLTDLDLARCDLSRVDFHGSDLAGADLSSSDLSQAFLAGAQFLGADLRSARFDNSNISYADFRGANFGPVKSTVSPFLLGAHLPQGLWVFHPLQFAEELWVNPEKISRPSGTLLPLAPQRFPTPGCCRANGA